MSRVKRKNSSASKTIGERFAYAIEEELGWTLAHAARELGYTNPTTLYAIKKGKALPDPERLVTASQRLIGRRGLTLNLHWVLTGVGPVLFDARKDQANPRVNDDIINLISKLTEEQKGALRTLLRRKK